MCGNVKSSSVLSEFIKSFACQSKSNINFLSYLNIAYSILTKFTVYNVYMTTQLN